MRTSLTTEQIDSYRDTGFLVVEDLLDPGELEHWRRVVDHAIAVRRTRRFGTANHLSELDERAIEELTEDEQFYRQVFTQHVNLWQTDADVTELMFDERIGRMMADLADVDGIRIWHDQALVKHAYANVTAFHLDVPNWSFTSSDALSLWVALDDATIENGCLHYLSGSHKDEKYDNVPIGRELGALFEVYPEWADVAPQPCPVPAGGACIHNGLTFHGAGANMTPGLRRAMTCAYMPDGATFNGQPNVLPPAYLDSLTIGDELCDDRHNPLIFHRDADQTLATA